MMNRLSYLVGIFAKGFKITNYNKFMYVEQIQQSLIVRIVMPGYNKDRKEPNFLKIFTRITWQHLKLTLF